MSKVPNAHPTVFPITMLTLQSFFPGLFLYVYIKSPNPKWPCTTGPKPHQLKTPAPETQFKTPTPKPQPQKHHKWARTRKNIIRITSGKNIYHDDYLYTVGEGRVTTEGQPLEQMDTEEPPAWVKEQMRRQRKIRRRKICIIVSVILSLLLIGGGLAAGLHFGFISGKDTHNTVSEIPPLGANTTGKWSPFIIYYTFSAPTKIKFEK